MHIGVLTAVIDQHAFGGDFVGIGARIVLKKRRVHLVKRLPYSIARGGTHPKGVAVCQQHKSLPVGHGGRVLHAARLKRPTIQTTGQTKALHVRQCMARPVKVMRAAGMVKGHGPVKYKARGTDQMPVRTFIHRAIV